MHLSHKKWVQILVITAKETTFVSRT